MFEQPHVVALACQHAEEEHQGEEYHHGFYRHGEFHFGHEGHVYSKGCEQGHAEQAGLETDDKKEQYETCQGEEGEVVEIL